mgnify:CR=1 FL=1
MSQPIKKTISYLLAGFLITYHSVKIYNTYFLPPIDVTHQLIWITSLRLMIVLSFITLAFKPKLGLVMMWIFIGSLVATQIYAQWDNTWQDMLGPFKGLIIPSLITWLMKPNHSTT